MGNIFNGSNTEIERKVNALKTARRERAASLAVLVGSGAYAISNAVVSHPYAPKSSYVEFLVSSAVAVSSGLLTLRFNDKVNGFNGNAAKLVRRE